MPELEQNGITRLQDVLYRLKVPFQQELAGTATVDGAVVQCPAIGQIGMETFPPPCFGTGFGSFVSAGGISKQKQSRHIFSPTPYRGTSQTATRRQNYRLQVEADLHAYGDTRNEIEYRSKTIFPLGKL